MTQEQKDLLLKDLCVRLPHKVKVQIKNVSKVCTLKEIDCNDDEMSVAVKHENGELNGYDFDLAKPYLLPMSSMTEEQQKEYRKVCDLDMTILENRPMKGEPFPAMYNSQDWLDANHFDYRGLIPMGLAIDATGKNIY
jgi:hypothetical protein